MTASSTPRPVGRDCPAGAELKGRIRRSLVHHSRGLQLLPPWNVSNCMDAPALCLHVTYNDSGVAASHAHSFLRTDAVGERAGRSCTVSPRLDCILPTLPILKRPGRAPTSGQCVGLCPDRFVALPAPAGCLSLLPGLAESTSSLSSFSLLPLVAYPALRRFVDFGVLSHGCASSFEPLDVFLAQPIPSRSTHTSIEPEQRVPCL